MYELYFRQYPAEIPVKKNIRFEVLDGLRGIAAFAVLLLHITPGNAIAVAPHAALAVDFFFALSGFVIAAAYGKRLTRDMGVAAFVRLRLIRLYPLIALGALFGAVGYMNVYDAPVLALLFVTGLLLIPTPFGAISEDQTLIPINPASWSLLWELLVNILFALIAPRLGNRLLALIIFASGIALIASGSLFGGLNIGSFWRDGWAGIPRVLFSFFAGVALFRLYDAGKLDQFRAPAWVAALSLCVAMMVPQLGTYNLVYDAVVVVVFFPLLLAVGANASVNGFGPLCNLFGAVSYPAYILQSGITPHLRGLPGHLHLQGAAATVLGLLLGVLFVLFSWIALKTFDEPVRKWLMGRRRETPRAATAP